MKPRMLKTLLLAACCGIMGIAATAEFTGSQSQFLQQQESLCISKSERHIVKTRRRGRRRGRSGKGGRGGRTRLSHWMRKGWHNAWNINWNRLEKKIYH